MWCQTKSCRRPAEAERAVQTIDNALKKEKDPAKALMSYRATPLENRYSPAKMLLATKIRTTVPLLPDQLKPSWPGLQERREHKQESKIVQTKRYNVSHRWTELPALKPGGGLRIRKKTISCYRKKYNILVLCGSNEGRLPNSEKSSTSNVPATDSPTGAPSERGDNPIIFTITAVGIPK